MYKTRIKQWGLDKKHKENEMRAIVHKTKTLGSQGRSATFRVRGRHVDYKDVISYFKRKNVRLEDVIAQRTGSKTPEAVDYLITVPSPIRTPESIAIPERILVSIRDYFRGSFENGTWVTTDMREGCQTTRGQRNSQNVLAELDDDVMTACELFDRNDFQGAGQNLIAATSRIKVIILAEHPDTLQFIFRIIEQLFGKERYEFALAILRQYSALAEIIMGKTHPIGSICGWLASIAPLQWKSVIARCTGSLVDHFETLAGPLNRSTVLSRLEHIGSDFSEHSIHQRMILLKDLLHKCETDLGLKDDRTAQVRLWLAWGYFDLLDYAKAKRVCWDGITFAQHLFVGQRSDFYFYIEGLYTVAISEYAMGNTYSAEIHLRRAIELRLEIFGPNDSRVRRFLVILEGWLVEQGYFGSAAQVHQRWKESLVDCTDFV